MEGTPEDAKKFSLRMGKNDGKVDFEGSVHQFEEYTMLRHWSDKERASLLFLSITGGARMYFFGLPERENMTYALMVEALR